MIKWARVGFAYGFVSLRERDAVVAVLERRAHLQEAHVERAAFNVKGIHAARAAV